MVQLAVPFASLLILLATINIAYTLGRRILVLGEEKTYIVDEDTQQIVAGPYEVSPMTPPGSVFPDYFGRTGNPLFVQLFANSSKMVLSGGYPYTNSIAYMNSTNPSDWGSWTYAAEIAGAGEVLQPTPDDLEGLLYIPQFTSYSYAPKGLVLELGSDTPANSTSAMPERLCNVGQKAKDVVFAGPYIWVSCYNENDVFIAGTIVRFPRYSSTIAVQVVAEIMGYYTNLAWDGGDYIYWGARIQIPSPQQVSGYHVLFRAKINVDPAAPITAEEVGNLYKGGTIPVNPSGGLVTIRIMTDGFLYGVFWDRTNNNCILKWSLPDLQLQETGGVRNASACAWYIWDFIYLPGYGDWPVTYTPMSFSPSPAWPVSPPVTPPFAEIAPISESVSTEPESPTLSDVPALSPTSDWQPKSSPGLPNGELDHENVSTDLDTEQLAAAIAAPIACGLVLVLVVTYLVLRFRWRKPRGTTRKQDETPTSELPSGKDASFRLSSSQSRSFEMRKFKKSFNINYAELVIETKIGEGEFGTVFKGKWRGAAVAIKEIEASQEMLKQVAKLLLNMQPHKNITQIYGVCQHEDKMLVVMEYLLGGSLERLMQKRKRKGTPLSDEEIIRLATGIASGMVHLHAQKIFHRDLEARNILIAPENNHLVIKLSHFGLSLPDPSHDSSDVHEETKVGSARWMAPESLQRQVYSAKSDVFSFGVLLWELVTVGELPLKKDRTKLFVKRGDKYTEPKLPVGCPPIVADICSQCWCVDPTQRPTFQTIWTQLSKWESARQREATTSSESSE